MQFGCNGSTLDAIGRPAEVAVAGMKVALDHILNGDGAPLELTARRVDYTTTTTPRCSGVTPGIASDRPPTPLSAS